MFKPIRKTSVDSAVDAKPFSVRMDDGDGKARSIKLDDVSEENMLRSPSTMFGPQGLSIKVPHRRAAFTPVTRIEKTDPIWSMYVKEAHARDKEMIEAWSNNMDVLLVFAGLFSAILTAFLIELHQALKEDPTDLTHEYLKALVQRLDYIVDNGTTPISPFRHTAFMADARSVRVNFYWFTSLTFSLLAAAGAMLAKQWFREYSHNATTGSHYDQAHLRQQRFDGLEKWGFREVVDLLPTLMHLALILFFVGLIDFLWGLYFKIGVITMVFFLSGITFAFVTTFLAIHYPTCPYRTPLTNHTTRLLQAIRGLSHLFRKALKYSPVGSWVSTAASITDLHMSKSMHLEVVERDDLEALMWMLRESRYEETVRASLKLIPAVSTTPERRDQVARAGAITRICDFFDPAHPDYQRVVDNDRDAIAFGLALRGLLAKPRPALPKHLILEQVLSLPLDYMANHSNINLRILAASFLPLDVVIGDVVQGIHYEMLDQVTNRPYEVEPWARILLLNALREWMIFIRTGAPQEIVRKPENAPVVILNQVASVGLSAPKHQVNQDLLGALLASMTVTLGGSIPDALGSHSPYRTSDFSLGFYLGLCLDEMKRHKEQDGTPATPGIDHTNAPAVIPLSDVEPALVKLLQVVNQLLPRHPQIFGTSWSSSIAKLIDFSHDSEDQEVVDLVLKTMLLVHRDTLEMSCSPDQFKRLLYMCIVRPSFDELPLIPDPYFLDILRLMEHVLPSLGVDLACPLLLEEADKLALSFVPGLQKDNNNIHTAILQMTDYIFATSHSDSEILDQLADQLVEAGLLDALLALMKRTPFGPKRSQVVKPIGWLGRSSKASDCLGKDSVLDDLVATMTSMYGQDYAARAIILLWDSAKRGSSEAQYLDLTRRIISSGFLFTLSGWFERDTVGDNLYHSYREIQAIWPGLFKDVLEVSPSALVRSARLGAPRGGVLSAILDHLARTYSDSFLGMPQSEQEAVGNLGEDLGKLEQLAKEEVTKLETLTASTRIMT